MAFADDHEVERAALRERILQQLNELGYRVEAGKLEPPAFGGKADVRAFHAPAVSVARTRSEEGLRRHEEDLLRWFANGEDVTPQDVKPRLVVVEPDSEEELVFRYTRLHWSIPTSPGYGRRLRLLVLDSQNDKLIGIIGLGDPVFALKDRDAWVGWSRAVRSQAISLTMDAFVLGAVPPYSMLMGGKLVALLAASNEVRQAFRARYSAGSSFISRASRNGDLAMLTTASALGRSSIYNRLTFRGSPVYVRVGATSGTGEVAFSDGLYPSMLAYARRWCTPTARHPRWGAGFRNRREVIKKCLGDVGLSTDWVVHGLRRELYVVPLASNCRAVLQGDESALEYLDRPAADLADWHRTRWLLPRASRDQSYRSFRRDSYRLWIAGT